MYSGTTFTNASGNLLGVHQRINRAAHKGLSSISSMHNFPHIKQINHFEGRNGPDGIKNKSPSQDEPWHYYDPYDPDDTQLLQLIRDHYSRLVEQLKIQNLEKSAFEAAWMSHALVDGLTPAHHYPYEHELQNIRGSAKETRNTIKSKIVVKGENTRDSIRKNWQIIGPKGLITTHALFEMGVVMILAPHTIRDSVPSEEIISQGRKIGIEEMFMRSARRIAGEFAYDEFYRKGWTPSLARWVRNDLLPEITKIVTLGWYLALKEAGMANRV
jgi:hypothetical protein